jgi:LmbE family N-acetylglucosaminyl deacetylase
VAIAARTAQPIILTVFAGQPAGDISAFAASMHEQWGLNPRSVAKRRRAEDRCAAAALGASVRTEWLDELDAIYRNVAYNSDEALFGKVLAEDLPVIERLVEAFAAHDADDYLVPLAVGKHVDHQLVFRAGRRLAAWGASVWAYADVPYALDDRRLTPRLATGTVREVRLTQLDDDAFERKCAAIGCYASQLGVIFRDHGDFRSAIDPYHRQVGGGTRAEVCWRVLPSRA